MLQTLRVQDQEGRRLYRENQLPFDFAQPIALRIVKGNAAGGLVVVARLSV